MRNSRLAVVTLAASLFCTMISRDAHAGPFEVGDFVTFVQDDWGTQITAAGVLLSGNFTALYGQAGFLEVGSSGTTGFSILFTSASAFYTYLPSSGVPGPLIADLVDPTSTGSGIFGGEVTALRLNVDFSDAGYVLGSQTIPFGDLVIHDYAPLPQANGLSVRPFLGQANSLLGGNSIAPYSISFANTLVQELNASFSEGQFVSDFAQDHLQIAPAAQPVPEPATLSLLGIGVTAVIMRRITRRD
jgi:hypothetical protein